MTVRELLHVDILKLAVVGALPDRFVVSVDDLRCRTVAGGHDLGEFAGVEIQAGRLHFSGYEFDFGFQLDQRQIVSVFQSPFVVGWVFVNLLSLVEIVGFHVLQ